MSRRATHWTVTGENPDDYDPRPVKVAAGWIVADAKGNHYSVQAYPTRAQAEAWIHGYNTAVAENG